MNIFIERFVLAILAAFVVLLAFTNPMGFSLTARIISIVVIVAVAGLAAWFSENYRVLPKITVEPSHLILLGLIGAAVSLAVAAGGYIWQQSRSTEWLLSTDAVEKFAPANLVQDWKTKKQTEDSLTGHLQKLSSGFLHGENPSPPSSLNIEVQKSPTRTSYTRGAH